MNTLSSNQETRIQVLPPGVAERIAAGEVIERPASVIKELVENSLDAGATEVAVFLEDGGKNLIEIVDNGHGMGPDDLALSIERHATSKLQSLEDLDRISTLGFRGEALASVAAVADLNILSRSQNSKSAYELQAGDVTERKIHRPLPSEVTFGLFLNSTHGTRIRASGLFSQIPARLKFLKSQASEVSQTREWLERLALAHPHVGFHLVSNDRTVLKLRPEDEVSRVRAILSDGDDYPILTAEHDQDGFRDLGLKIRLHWVQGLSASHSRKLIQIVNSRAIKDRMLQQAVLAPFKQALLPGQFPAVALIIEINPAAIDVNVHPSKIEVRFLDNRKIFSAIDTLVKSLVARHGAPAIAASPFKSSPVSYNLETKKTQQGRLWQASEQPLSASISPEPSPIRSQPNPASWFGLETSHSNSQVRLDEPRTAVPEHPVLESPLSSQTLQTSDVSKAPDLPRRNEISLSNNPFVPNSDPLESARYAGSLFNTYIIYEKKNEMILVDQHAAHERVRYETLRKKFLKLRDSSLRDPDSAFSDSFHSQALLIPEAIRIPSGDHPQLSTWLKQLSAFGFETELSDSMILFRSVPADWGTHQLKPRLRNLIDRILSSLDSENSSPSANPAWLLDEATFELLASQACHSSVRAGDPLELEESTHLVKELFQCEHPWNCPHGRPTVVYVPQSKFEEWFQRRVPK